MKKLFALIVVVLQLQFLSAQVTFNKTYDYNSGVDLTNNVLVLDSGYFMPTYSGHPVIPGYICFVKTDISGDTVFEKCYGGQYEYYTFNNILKLNNGNFISGAFLSNFITRYVNICLYKIDSNADSIWTKNYFAPIDSVYLPWQMISLSDGGFLLSGEIADSAATDYDTHIFKVDSNGNKVYENKKGGVRAEGISSSVETSDHGFLSIGFTRSYGFGNNSNSDMYLIKWDSMGVYQWQKTFGTPLNDAGRGITKTADGNYLLSGFYSGSSTSVSGWVLKIDEQGNIIWQYIAPLGVTELFWARENANGTIICAGSKSSPVNGLDEGWILKLDSTGHFLWDRTFQMNNNHCYFRDVELTPDGGYICAGFVFTGASGNEDAWLVKLDSLGCDSIGCANYVGLEEVDGGNKFKEIQMFPNPARDFVSIIFGVEPTGRVKFEIYNELGEKVKEGLQFSNKYLSINVNDLSSGIYLINVNYDGENKVVRFVKE